MLNGWRETHLTGVLPVLFIGVAPDGGNLLVIPRHGGEGFVGNAFIQFVLPGESDDGIATFDVMVKKVEWLAGVVSL